jgi:hypothetical protein
VKGTAARFEFLLETPKTLPALKYFGLQIESRQQRQEAAQGDFTHWNPPSRPLFSYSLVTRETFRV